MSAKSVVSFPRHRNQSPRVFCEREIFVDALCRERRRCERSGNTFMLGLVYLDHVQHDEESNVEETVISAICSILRDTDVPGWYKDGKTIGIIYTDLKDQPRDFVRSKIHDRLMEALQAALPAETLAQLKMTYHFYPESDGSSVAPVDPVLYLEPSRPVDSNNYRIMKRCFDIVGSALGVLLTAPLLLLIAIAIKLTSKGPVFFRQTRIGQGGKPFVFLKFRSMYVNNDHSIHRDYVTRMIAGQKVAHDDGTATGLYKIHNDPRITRVGAILRRSSLDEMPQLFNVLKGDMSLIGPRPPVPYEVERYSPWHRRRLTEAKPGITGLWQVSGRSRTTFDEMVRLDLQYVLRWSLWLDLKILLKTPLAVVSGNGAY
jgi:exopolysaccharide biosynthesis polyprenyl glycosylphosphotransferase